MKGKGCELPRPGGGDSAAGRVRYEPGNLGDLLKHLWLIATLTFLRNQQRGSPFRYADTFCGFKDYEIHGFFAWRIRKHLSPSPLYRAQKASLTQGRYLGSACLARRVLGSSARIDIFDTNPLAVRSFNRQGIRRLKLASGYDVLERKEHYDLIFLDPYDDARGCHEGILRRILRKTAGSSILLFLPHERTSDLEGVMNIIRSSGARCLHGSVGPGEPRYDGRYSFALFFFPRAGVGETGYQHLAKKIRRLTAGIQRLSSPAAASGDRFAQPLQEKKRGGHP